MSHQSAVIDSLHQVINQQDAILRLVVARLATATMAAGDTVVRVALPADVPRPAWYESALLQTLVGGALALLGGIIVEKWRNRAERRRTKEHLIRRIRAALETAMVVARSTIRLKDETKEIGAETMNAIIIEWQRYDRVSNEIGLLNDPKMEDEIETILQNARVIAERILEEERRYRATMREVGTSRPQGIEVDASVLEGIRVARRGMRGLLGKMADRAEGIRDRFNAKWKPPQWHEQPQVAEPTEPEKLVKDTSAPAAK
jgi:hypothetical protein